MIRKCSFNNCMKLFSPQIRGFFIDCGEREKHPIDRAGRGGYNNGCRQERGRAALIRR